MKYSVTFTCTCGQQHVEYFMNNGKSIREMLKFVIYLISVDNETVLNSIVVQRNDKDVTLQTMLTIALMGASKHVNSLHGHNYYHRNQ